LRKNRKTKTERQKQTPSAFYVWFYSHGF